MPHIPQGTTDTVALELFDPALDAALRPSPDYDVSRWLYVPNTYSEYRYILGTRGQKPLICVGINPSTAAPDALGDAQKQALRTAFRMASEPRTPAEPLDWMETTCPARWKTQEGEAEYDWFEDFGAEPLKR